MQSAGLPKLNSTQIRGQEVHSNGPVLDDELLSDPEVCTAIYPPCMVIIVKYWMIELCSGLLFKFS